MPAVMFVCTANLCRSPIAEQLFRTWLERQAVAGHWHVASSGTWAHEKIRISTASTQCLLTQGIDLRQHRSRNITQDLIAASDLVLCMTHFHKEALQLEFPGHAGRIRLLSEMHGQSYDIPDVQELKPEHYLAVAKSMVGVIEKAAPRIVELLGQA